MIEIVPVSGVGEVRAGDDLASLIVAALDERDEAIGRGDVLVITQKIVSKSEDRWVDLEAITPSQEAVELARKVRKDERLVETILRESTAVIRAVPNVLITRHRCGLVMANAGIDQSNLGDTSGDRALLLPEDPDQSARGIRLRLEKLLGWGPGVVITDSFGRPWRYGIVPVAIGAAGFPALHDRRGEIDRDGRVLAVTQTALGDMVAAAAGLVTGEGAESIPAALIRGLPLPNHALPAASLVRPLDEDLFK